MVARWEPLQPSAADYLPTLWMADGAAQWATVASNYLGEINEQLAPDATINQLSRQLVKGLAGDEAKLTALARYVQTNCTYKAIEFGRRARVPNKPTEILRNQYGDCKDHAVLLQQLLESSGVPAHLALAKQQGLLQKDLPSLDQFDHMVVYAPGKENGTFIDCTDKGMEAGYATPFGLAGREVFILDAREPRFEAIPCYTAGASQVDIERHLRFAQSTDVQVQETILLKGVHAAHLRNLLLQIPSASRRMSCQRQIGLADVELTEFQAEPLEQPSVPLQLRCYYTIKNCFRQADDRLTGTLRADVARSYLAAEPVDNRLTPFELLVPFSLRSVTVLDVPEGFHAITSSNPVPKVDVRFVVCQENHKLENQRLILEFECRQPAGKFEPRDYPAYRETMAQAISLLERQVVMDKDRR